MYAIFQQRGNAKSSLADLSSRSWNVSQFFSPIKKLSATECQRLASAAVTDTAETDSGWQVSCVTANTTCTVSSQWLEASGVHVVRGRDNATSGSTQYLLPHEGLTAAALIWTGHQETHKDEVAAVKTDKCESSNQSDSDITSELLTAQTKVTCLWYTPDNVALSILNAQCVQYKADKGAQNVRIIGKKCAHNL